MSISLQEMHRNSISSFSQHKINANQGLVDKLSFKSINDFFLFPFYDELLQVIKINSIFSFLMIIVFLIHAVKTFLSFSNNLFVSFFTDFNFSAYYEAIFVPVIYFMVDIFYFAGVIFQYRIKRMFSYRQLYFSSVILSFFNVIFFVPTCGVCGYSVIQIHRYFSYNNSYNFTEFRKFESDLFSNSNNNLYLYDNFNKSYSNKINTSKKYANYGYKSNCSSNNIYHITHDQNYNNQKETKKEVNSKYNKIQHLNATTQIIFHNDIPKNKRKESNYIKNVKFKNKIKSNKKGKRTKMADPIKYNSTYSFFESMTKDDDNEDISNRELTKYIFSLIYTLVEATIFTIQITYHSHFISESPFLDRSIFSMWDSRVFISYVTLIGVNQFLSQVLILFPKWCSIFYHFLVLIIDINILYYTFFQPFIKVAMNAFFQALITYNFSSNIVIIIYLFEDSKRYIHVVQLMTLSFIPFYIVFYLIDKSIIKKVNNRLSPEYVAQNEEDIEENSRKLLKYRSKKSINYEITDSEKNEIFDKFVFQSTDHALLYFRVGVSCSSPFFIDFSFLQYMRTTYSQIPIQLEILRFSSLFPSQHTFFSLGLSILSKREDFLSVYQQCVMYQLHKINNKRQSNFSKEVQQELFLLDKMSDEAISAIRGFWVNILQTNNEFNMSSLGFIRAMTMNTKTCYIDAITKFPSSVQILNSYCRFLCESCGDYIECVRIAQRIKLIEQGKFVNADFCFHSFVNVFPQYLKRRIINEKGSFIFKNDTYSSTSLSTWSTTRLSTSFDNIVGIKNIDFHSNDDKNYNYKKLNKDDFEHLLEHENFDTLINTLFKNGKARLSIQQILDRSHNNSLIIVLLIAFIQTICFIGIMIFEFQFISSYQIPIRLIDSSARTSKIIFSLQYCSLIAGMQYLSETYNTNISSKMLEYLKIEDENLPNFTCTFINPMASLQKMAQNIDILIDDEMKFIISNPKNYEQEIKIYTEFDILEKYDEAYINKSSWEKGIFIYKFNDKNYSVIKISLRNGLEYLSAIADRLAYEHFKEGMKTNPSYSQFNDYYFELLLNSLTISEPFFHLFNVISKNGINLITSNERALIIITSVVLVGSLVIFLAARLYGYMKIRKLMSIISQIVKNVKYEDIKEAMNPIFLKTQKIIKVHSTSKHSIYESSYVIILYPIFTFFSVVNALGIFSISIFLIRSSFTFIRNAQKWENDGASRFLCLTKMINCLISEHLGIENITMFEDLKQSSVEMLDMSNKLDLSIIGKGKALNQFYFIVNDNVYVNSYQSSNPFQGKIKVRSKRSYLNIDEQNIYQSSSNVKCSEISDTDSFTNINLATYLDCISVENKVNMGILYYQLIENSIKSDNLLESPEFITLLFIVDKYLYNDLPRFQDKISEITLSEVQKQKKNVYIVGSVGIFVALVFFVIELIFIKRISFSYDAFKQLILVLPPSSFISNSYLVNYLTNSFSYSFRSKNVSLIGNNLSYEEILFNSIDDAILTIDKNLIIQSVNPAVQKMTGFLADQLLGQTLPFIIPLTSRHFESFVSLEKFPFYQRLGEIINDRGNKTAELDAKVLTDKGEEILVRATIIGMYEKKKKTEVKARKSKKQKQNEQRENNNNYNSNELELDLLVDPDEQDNFKSNNSNINIIDTDDDNSEQFKCASIILSDISRDIKVKKELKEAKKKNEILLNFLLPQPVLEKIRGTNKPAYYMSETATLINFELVGLDTYLGTMNHKAIMSAIQFIYSKIEEINKAQSSNKQFLFNKRHKSEKNHKLGAFRSYQNPKIRFHSNANSNSMNDEQPLRLMSSANDLYELNTSCQSNSKSTKSFIDEDEDYDNQNVDFNCIYNVRNDNDRHISIAGLFDTQNELQKQAESCLCYALKMKEIVEKIGQNDQINMFVHSRIAVCMGGPVSAYVEDIENPELEFLSNMVRESDKIKNITDWDVVYINQGVYNNINRENFEIEEKIAICNNENYCQRVYMVHKRLKNKEKRKNDDDIDHNVFIISTGSDN